MFWKGHSLFCVSTRHTCGQKRVNKDNRYVDIIVNAYFVSRMSKQNIDVHAVNYILLSYRVSDTEM